MSAQVADTQKNATVVTNGSGAAAILAAGIGSFAIALFAIAADKSAFVKDLLVFYKPTGVLSGETTVAVLVWLAFWVILELRWRKRNVSLARVNLIALVLLGLGLLLTFPPIGDLF
jgi:hypothetical protein